MKSLFLVLSLLSFFLFLCVLICAPYSGICEPINSNYVLLAAIGIHLGLLSIALYFLWSGSIKATFAKIGISKDLKSHIFYSLVGLLSLFLLLLVLGFFSSLLGFNDQERVSEKVSDLPFMLLVFAIVLAPLSEEFFFRAFLVPRFGVLISAFLFGIAHFTYGSIVEVLGAFVIGFLLGSIFKKSKSIVPCIIIHMTYNLISIIAIKFLV